MTLAGGSEILTPAATARLAQHRRSREPIFDPRTAMLDSLKAGMWNRMYTTRPPAR